MWVATKMRFSKFEKLKFQPRNPAGCDKATRLFAAQDEGFNPRTPAGCDTMGERIRQLRLEFQPTHPCGVRLPDGYTPQRLYDVSTHAPLRGATRHSRFRQHSAHVSTHAPLRGATHIVSKTPEL